MRDLKVFGHHLSAPFVVLSAFDVVMAGAVLYWAAHDQEVTGQGAMVVLALTGAVTVFVTKASVGLYHLRTRVNIPGIFARMGVAFMLGIPVIAVVAALSAMHVEQLLVILMACAIAYGFLATLHAAFFALADAGVLRRKVLVLGNDDPATWLTRLRRRADQRGFEIVSFMTLPAAKGRERAPDNTPLWQWAEEQGIQEIVIALADRRAVLPLDELQECRLRGINVVDAAEFIEREARQIRLDLIRPGWLVFGGNRVGRVQDRLKRLMDICAATGLLIMALPLVIATAIAIKWEEGVRAPLLYRQTRIGKEGVPFELIKFRSMRVDAEADGEARWATKDDARITRVGRLIRKMRIDELPQLFNVLLGQMSMVGPRPERPAFVEKLAHEIPHYQERHRIKPGLTGWAQVTCPYGASLEDAQEKLQYDLYYLKNRSLLLDAIILLQTVEVVLFGKGAR